MVGDNMQKIKEQAILLAQANKKAEPGIKKVYWFPDDREVRLIEVEDEIPPSIGDVIEPFYFDPSLQDDLPAPSGVALIRSDEIRRLQLPQGWGDWDHAEELVIEE